MRYLVLAVFLIGCGGSGGSESDVDAGPLFSAYRSDWAVTVNPGQALGCVGTMYIVTYRLSDGAPTQITGKWTCAGLSQFVVGGDITDGRLGADNSLWMLMNTGASITRMSGAINGPMITGTIPLSGVTLPFEATQQ